jgi:hypothetical protein
MEYSDKVKASVVKARAKRIAKDPYTYHTSVGKFDTIQDAAKQHGISVDSIRTRFKSGMHPEWYMQSK